MQLGHLFAPHTLIYLLVLSALHKIIQQGKLQGKWRVSAEKQEASLVMLQARLPEALQAAGCGLKGDLWGVPLSGSPGPGTDELLHQFLNARGWDVERAARMLEGALRWRREFGVDRLRAEDFSDLPADEIAPHPDADGCSVVTLRLGQVPKCAFRDRGAQQLSEARMVRPDSRARHRLAARYLRWRLCMQEAGMRSLRLGRGLEQARPGYVYVLDCTGLKAIHVSKAARRCATDLAKVLQEYYPDYLKGTRIINAPGFVTTTWSIFRQFLPISFTSGVQVSSRGEGEVVTGGSASGCVETATKR